MKVSSTSTRYHELILAIEEAETVCSLVEDIGQNINEDNVAHKHIYGVLCDRAVNKVNVLIGAALRYNKQLEMNDNADR